MSIDKEALSLAMRWQRAFIRNAFKELWFNFLDALEGFGIVLLYPLRIVFFPILIIYSIWSIRGSYKTIVASNNEQGRARIRKHIQRNERLYK